MGHKEPLSDDKKLKEGGGRQSVHLAEAGGRTHLDLRVRAEAKLPVTVTVTTLTRPMRGTEAFPGLG